MNSNIETIQINAIGGKYLIGMEYVPEEDHAH